jgi:hypothetical protein
MGEKNILRIEEEQTTYKNIWWEFRKKLIFFCFVLRCVCFSFVEPNHFIGQGRITEVASKFF